MIVGTLKASCMHNVVTFCNQTGVRLVYEMIGGHLCFDGMDNIKNERYTHLINDLRCC